MSVKHSNTNTTLTIRVPTARVRLNTNVSIIIDQNKLLSGDKLTHVKLVEIPIYLTQTF